MLSIRSADRRHGAIHDVRARYSCALLILVIAIGAQADGIRRVAPSGMDRPGCGTPEAPCQTIQSAIDQAVSGDVIQLAYGTYTSTGAQVAELDFGPGAGKSLSFVGGYDPLDWLPATSDPALTLLDGQNSRRVMLIVSVDPITVALQNLTIQNGLADDSHPVPNTGEFSGGGLLCRNDHPHSAQFVTLHLSNVVFKDNRVRVNGSSRMAASGGGASFYFRCSANLDRVRFENNSVEAGMAPDDTRGGQALGGGFFLSGGFGTADRETRLVGNRIRLLNNRAVGGSGGRGQGSADGLPADALGGGAAIQLSRASLREVWAVGNQATGGNASAMGGTAAGGGLFFELNTGTVTVSGGTLAQNRVIGGASATGMGGIGAGGALMSTDSLLALERLNLVGNTSLGGLGNDGGDAGGGALYLTRWHADSDNRAWGSDLVIADNEAQAGQGAHRYGGGGGIFSQDTALTLTHVTLANNRVLNSMQGAAVIGLHNANGSQTAIRSSIVANHHIEDIYDNPRAPLVAQQAGDAMSLSQVLFHDNTHDLATGTPYAGQPGLSGAAFFVSDEMTGNPAFLSPKAPENDYRLTALSTAINTAPDSMASLDMLGNPRPTHGIADVGAIEFAPLRLLATSGFESIGLIWRTDRAILTPAAARFEVAYRSEAGGSESVVEVGDVSEYRLTGLIGGQRYLVHVRALDATGGALAVSNDVSAVAGSSLVSEVILGLYRGFFLRAPDATGFAEWESRFDRGEASLAGIAEGFVAQETLGYRSARQGSLTAEELVDLARIAEGFIAHPYAQETLGYRPARQGGLTDREFVEAIYANILNGTGDQLPGPAEVDYWLQSLSSAAHSRASMVLAFVTDALTIDIDAIPDPVTQAAARVRQQTLIHSGWVARAFMSALGKDGEVSSAAKSVPGLLASDPAFVASQRILSGVNADDRTLAHAASFLMESLAGASDPIGRINQATNAEIFGDREL